MKKFISILCMVALFSTMVCTVALADDSAVVTATISGDATTAGSDFTVDISYSGLSSLFDTSKFVFKGIVGFQFKMAIPEGYAVSANLDDDIAFDESFFEDNALYNVDGSTFVFAASTSQKQNTKVCTESEALAVSIPLSCVTAPSTNVTFTLSEVKIIVEEYSAKNTLAGSVTHQVASSNLTVNNATATASAPGPSVDTFTATTTIGNSGDAVKSQNPGGVEYGSAFRIAFTRPAAATSDDAIFGVTAGSAKKYSPKQVDILKGLTGDITMDVSFLNGREGSISPQKIDAVSVILANAEGTQFFYSDAEDASNKSK